MRKLKKYLEFQFGGEVRKKVLNEIDGGLFAVGAGRIISEYSGLMQDPKNPVSGDWYYFANGQAQTQYTGLAMYDNVWFYIVKWKLATYYTGPVNYNGSTFNVENGMVK